MADAWQQRYAAPCPDCDRWVGVPLTPGEITLCVSDLAIEQRPLDTEFVGAAATSTSANEIEGGELRRVRSVYFQK